MFGRDSVPLTATRDLVALEGQGALTRSEEGGRSTRYFLTL